MLYYRCRTPKTSSLDLNDLTDNLLKGKVNGNIVATVCVKFALSVWSETLRYHGPSPRVTHRKETREYRANWTACKKRDQITLMITTGFLASSGVQYNSVLPYWNKVILGLYFFFNSFFTRWPATSAQATWCTHGSTHSSFFTSFVCRGVCDSNSIFCSQRAYCNQTSRVVWSNWQLSEGTIMPTVPVVQSYYLYIQVRSWFFALGSMTISISQFGRSSLAITII